jgi:hypothetical protein
MKSFLLSILSATVFAVADQSAAETAVTPEHRLKIWNGPLSLDNSHYTIGETTAFGPIWTLKSTQYVIDILSYHNIERDFGGLDLIRDPGAKLHSKSWAGSEHQSVSDKYTYDSNGTSRQCVAFARSMTGTKKSIYWYPGNSLQDYVWSDGIGLKPSIISLPVPGTMIAHFRGKDRYPTSKPPWGHVAIFLSWSLNTNGHIDGVNVIDQNVTESVKINGTIIEGSNGLIQKHKLPWLCNAGKACGSGKYFITFYASGYHVVDVR